MGWLAEPDGAAQARLFGAGFELLEARFLEDFCDGIAATIRAEKKQR
jgi:hypothetical protein